MGMIGVLDVDVLYYDSFALDPRRSRCYFVEISKASQGGVGHISGLWVFLIQLGSIMDIGTCSQTPS